MATAHGGNVLKVNFMFQKLKNFLKRFLPVPARTFHIKMQEIQDKHNRDIGEIKSILKDLNKKTDNAILTSNDIKKATEDIKKKTDDIDKVTGNISKSTDELKKKTDNIDKATSDIGKTTEELKKKTDNIDKATGGIGKTTEELKKKTDDINKAAVEIKNITENIKKTTGDIGNVTEDIKKVSSENKATSRKIDQRIIDFETKFLKGQKQPKLSYFVLNILDHCNLKCKGCDHFAAIAEERFVPAQTIESDLKQISNLTEGAVTRIGIMGGEPLLHPDLLEVISAARKAFPNSLLQLISNGILLLKQSDDFWNVLRENNIQLVLTKYPINLDYEHMEEIAKTNNVNYSYNSRTGKVLKTLYKMPMDIAGRQDPKKSFWNCFHANTKPLLMEGRLYPCTIIPNVSHFNKKFFTNMEHEKNDYLNIYDVKDIMELFSFLNTPKPFCRYCKTHERTFGSPWERSKQDINEWT